MSTSLPTFSLQNLTAQDPEERRHYAKELGRACREIGFFCLSDYPVEPELLAGLFTQAHALFALPQKDKQALSILRSPHNRGYVALSDERLNPNLGADHKEAFNIGVDMPADHPEVLARMPFRGVNFWPHLADLKPVALDYFARCTELGRLLHKSFALDLDLPEHYFEPHLTAPIATLRLLHYPPATTPSSRHDAGAGAHSDYGNVTLLATDGVPGLELCTRDGTWLDVTCPAGALICNIGDCLMRWTNDTYRSTVHRVRQPDRERYSIAFFLEVNPESVIDPRDIFPHEPPRYARVTCATYLASRLDSTYAGRNTQTTSA